MIKELKLVPVLILFLFSSGSAQSTANQEKMDYVIVDSKDTLVAIASQLDSPIEISDFKFLIGVSTGARLQLQLVVKNRSSKPIRYISLIYETSKGTESSFGHGLIPDGERLNPGETISSTRDETVNVVPINEELRRRLGFDDKLRGLIIVFVREVAFADGTYYRDDKSSKALRDFFDATN